MSGVLICVRLRRPHDVGFPVYQRVQKYGPEQEADVSANSSGDVGWQRGLRSTQQRSLVRRIEHISQIARCEETYKCSVSFLRHFTRLRLLYIAFELADGNNLAAAQPTREGARQSIGSHSTGIGADSDPRDSASLGNAKFLQLMPKNPETLRKPALSIRYFLHADQAPTCGAMTNFTWRLFALCL